MNERTGGSFSLRVRRRPALLLIALGAMLCTYACGGDSHHTGAAANYPTGISEDIEQQLKYDARVESFDTSSSEDLIVNVNETWVHSPPGMQERSVGQWYNTWHSNHNGSVIVQYDGNKIASWTSQDGYKPETKSKTGESQSEG
ncbi:MAG: hypothetical protein AABO57_17695 [Acidobacteriota bacterium]